MPDPFSVAESLPAVARRPHKQAPFVQPEPTTFTETQFVATCDSIRRTQRGGAMITLHVDRDNIDAALKLWEVNVPLSIDIQPWKMYLEGDLDDDE